MSSVSKAYNAIRHEERNDADMWVADVTGLNSGTVVNNGSTENYTCDGYCEGSGCSYTPENRKLLFILRALARRMETGIHVFIIRWSKLSFTYLSVASPWNKIITQEKIVPTRRNSSSCIRIEILCINTDNFFGYFREIIH